MPIYKSWRWSLSSSGNRYLGVCRCNLLGKNTQKVPKDEPMLKIATEKENSDAWRIAVVKDSFTNFEKQSSTEVAWVELSFTVQLQCNKAYLLNYFWHWGFPSIVNQQLKIIIWNLLFDTFQIVFDSQWHKSTCRTPWLLNIDDMRGQKQGTKGCKESPLGYLKDYLTTKHWPGC